MKKSSFLICFIQGFGDKDLFSNVPSLELMGWKRNIGLLNRFLTSKGVRHEEKYLTDLSQFKGEYNLIFLRDWRYSIDQILNLKARYPNTPIISMMFKLPRYIEQTQRAGELKDLFGLDFVQAKKDVRKKEQGLFLCDRVVVNSPLNAKLLEDLGYPRSKMVLVPHTPIWTNEKEVITPFEPAHDHHQPSQNEYFTILFIGDTMIKKGLFRLYLAFQNLPFRKKKLTIVCKPLWKLKMFKTGDYPAQMLKLMHEIINDSEVVIQTPFSGLKQLEKLHQDADILICPSVVDCGPNVLVEAFQMGTPVLASDMCGSYFDFPNNSIMNVPGPRWWQSGSTKDNQLFTIRLRDKIIHYHNEYPLIINKRDRVDIIADQLNQAINSWDELFSKFLA